MISISSLTVRFGGVVPIDDLNLTLDVGVNGLIGPNGAGKTTCFNMLGGQTRPDRGSIRFAGREVAGLPAPEMWRLGLGRTFQVAATFPSMTVRENVQTALLSHHRRLWALWPRAGTLFAAEADALLAKVGMAAIAERASGVLSYGDLKRLELAMALAAEPRLLLMDEPTAGIAAGERGALMDLIVGIVADRGIGVLFIEHDMDVVFGHADRVIVLHRGAIVAEGPPEGVRADPLVRAIYLGTAATADGEGGGC